MIQAMSNQRFEAVERPSGQTATGSADFAELFQDAAKANIQKMDPPTPLAASASNAQASASNAQASASNAQASASDAQASASDAQATLGDPDVQGWLNTYYAQIGDPTDAAISDQPATGAGNNYPDGSVYGPDAIYTQALDNQIGNSFAGLTGANAADYTGQLPGIPSPQAQQQSDHDLAMENAQRLSWGQAIDTSAYWSDPGSLNFEGTTYTAQELGYAGPGQSSGPQPILISAADEIGTTGTYGVPGYSGTVSGVQPGCFYTLQQLEQAGLPSGQPDTQFHPGSWTTTPSA
jgi:hypothetical protein